MEKLIHLTDCLKANEIKLLRNFYVANGGAKKKLQLFNLILGKKAESNEEAAKKIYRQPPNSAFCHLKKRLEKDILDFLLLSLNSEIETDAAKEELKCRKLFMQGKILLSRGVYAEGMQLLKKTSRIAEKYEFPDIKLASDDTLNSYSFPKIRSQRYEHLIKGSLKQLENIYNAKTINYDLMEDKPKEPNQANVDGNIESSEFQLKQNCKDKGSKKAYYWYQLALLQCSYQKNEFGEAQDQARDLLSFLGKESAICSPPMLANVYLSLARVLIHLKKYTESITAADKAMALLNPRTLEMLHAFEIAFFAHFRAGSLTTAESICQHATCHGQINDRLKRKWTLLQAALKFSQCDFQLVNRTIHRNGYLKSDDPLWPLGQRLLEMLNILELEDYDWFEFKFESFRKKLIHIKLDTSGRLRTIYLLLKGLVKSNFNYLQAIQLEKDNFNLLNSSNLGLIWDPMGYELINVRDWILTKANKS